MGVCHLLCLLGGLFLHPDERFLDLADDPCLRPGVGRRWFVLTADLVDVRRRSGLRYGEERNEFNRTHLLVRNDGAEVRRCYLG